MTVIDELLVFFDDGESKTIDDCTATMEGRTKQTLSSTIGRLIGRGWMKLVRDKKSTVSRYVITDEGQSKVTRTLSHIALSTERHDGTWMFVVFNIAEKQRKYRDILRNRLSQVGFGRVQNSLWAAARDISFELDDDLSTRQIKENVTILRPTLNEIDAQEVARSFEWDWKTLADGYSQFIALADNYLGNNKQQSTLAARLLVYRYAKLLSQDPKFPEKLEPDKYPRLIAHNRYEQLREHCYA